MQNVIRKVFDDAAELQRWYERFTDSDSEEQTWIGPHSILRGFELIGDDDSGLYCEGEDVSNLPHTTDFDCGYFSSAGTWNVSLENLQKELHDWGSIQIDICYDEPLVNPDNWDWRYENPSPYAEALMEDYYDRKKQQEEEQEYNIVAEYNDYVDGFFCADEYNWDIDVDLAKQAKQLIDSLSPDNKQTFMELLWNDIIATELSKKEVEVEESYRRAKKEFDKLSAEKVFKEPFDCLRILKTCEEP